MSDLPRVIFFDCFNTLIEELHDRSDFPYMAPSDHMSVEAGFYAHRDEFRRDYADCHARNWDYDRGREVTYHERVSGVLHRRDPDRTAEIEVLVHEMVRRFQHSYPRGLRPAPGVVEMLEAWHGRARLAVVSNFHMAGYPERLLEAYGLLDFFEFVLNSAEFGWKKPDRRIYHEALARAGLGSAEAGQAVFIGDNLENDVAGPRAAGMRAILYTASPQPEGGQQRVAEPTLESWHHFRPDIWPKRD